MVKIIPKKHSNGTAIFIPKRIVINGKAITVHPNPVIPSSKWDKKTTIPTAIILSNDATYWNDPKRDTVDKAFRIYEGKILSGTLDWAERTGYGTRKGRSLISLKK